MKSVAAVMIQKNVRMWIAKKRYNILLAEKIIKVLLCIVIGRQRTL